MVFQQNLLEKAYFTAKMSGPAMVRPASFDFSKAPLDFALTPAFSVIDILSDATKAGYSQSVSSKSRLIVK